MPRFVRLAGLAAAASMLIAPVAQAAHRGDCGGDIGGAEGTPVVERGVIVDIGGTFYVDVRELAGQDQLFSIWVYQESNGVAGLQRGSGATPEPVATIHALGQGVVGNFADACRESDNPDAQYL